MSLLDGYEEELLKQQLEAQKEQTKGSLLEGYTPATPEAPVIPQQTFSEAHPFVASLPEAGKQLGKRSVKSFYNFGQGLNDSLALTGDKLGLQGLSDFGRSNAQFWGDVSNTIPVEEKYQGVKGLSSKETFIPTVLGSLGDNATNLAYAMAGGAGGAKMATQLGLKGLAKTGLITGGTAIPNLTQEGSYLDKIENFERINGRKPTIEELNKIQNVALTEKGVNTALETITDKMVFGRIFPQGASTKTIKKILKDAGQQMVSEAGTEGLQEGSSILAEKALGINEGNNLSRIADSMAIGGITGGIIGGAGSAISQPFDSNFPQNENAVNPSQAIKDVSAKIFDNGKEIYSSLRENYNNDTAFDSLRAMREPVNFDKPSVESTPALSDNDVTNLPSSNQVSDQVSDQVTGQADWINSLAKLNALGEEVQQNQNVAQPQVNNWVNSLPRYNSLEEAMAQGEIQDTGMPNLVENGNLYNIPSEEEVVSQQVAQNIANELINPAVEEQNNTAVLDMPTPTQTLEEIAPRIAEKVREKQSGTTISKPEIKEPLNGAKKRVNLSTLRQNMRSNKFAKRNLETVKNKKQGRYFSHTLNTVDNDFIRAERDFNDIIEEISKNPEKVNDNAYMNEVQSRVQKFVDEKVSYSENEEVALDYWDRFWKTVDSATQYNDLKAEKQSKLKEIAPNIAKKVEAKKNNKQEIEDYINSKPTIEEVNQYLGADIRKEAPEIAKRIAPVAEQSSTTENQSDQVGEKVKPNLKYPIIDRGTGEAVEISPEEIKNLKDLINDKIEEVNQENIKIYHTKEQANKVVSKYSTYHQALVKMRRADAKLYDKLFTLALEYSQQRTRSKSGAKAETLNNNIVKLMDDIINDNFNQLSEKVISKKETTTKKSKLAEVAPNIAKKKELNEKIERAERLLSGKEGVVGKFIPKSQKEALKSNLKGEEKEYFADKIIELDSKIKNAPKLYATEDIETNDKKPVLHYFGGSYDNYVFEIDQNSGEMFGAVSMGYGLELGYSDVNEIADSDSIELDLYYDDNQTYAEIKNEDSDIRDYQNEKGDIVYEEEQGTQRGELGRNSGISERTTTERQSRNEEMETRESETSRDVSSIRPKNYPITPEHKELTETKFKNQHELNQAIEKFIKNKEYEVYNGNLPQEITDWLKKYAGAGGLEKQGADGKGLLTEYYTPKNIIQKMWDLTKQYVNTKGAKVLEPSAGIGRFLEVAPDGTKFDVVEMNPVSAKITELLYPDANVEVGAFQERFIDKSNNTPVKNVTPEYDIIIGNPPYGAYSGLYKGLGEGKGISRLETYFIKRSVDLLNENGVMTFIIPSSFLDGVINDTKMKIGKDVELLDAYRLPENTFDTTSIGTDIIVLRKSKGVNNSRMLSLGNWFKEHPEKVLGEKLERKNRFGKQETYVKGDKNAVDNIKADKSDIKETVKVEKKETSTPLKAVVRKSRTAENNTKVEHKNVKYNEYKPLLTVSEDEYKYYKDTRVDGTLPKDKYSPNEKVNQYNGELYNDFNYLQGNIYDKLDALKDENISESQKDLQRKKLMQVLPKQKEIKEISLNPTSDFITNYSKDDLIDGFTSYLYDLGREERENVRTDLLYNYVTGRRVAFTYDVPGHIQGESAIKKYKAQQKIKKMAKLKQVADKLFNQYILEKTSEEVQNDIKDRWNRAFNNLYTPDFSKMPLIVKGLNDTFYGQKLKLNKLQEKGINFLTNKGIGLLGFEVGTGKTLSGIIATVQNMQMGRTKRPLILVPKQVKDNWIREINQTFPNIIVNDIGNLSNFKGNIEDGTISVGTYEALKNIWYEPEVIAEMTEDLFSISSRVDNTDYTDMSADQVAKAQKSTKRKAQTDLEKAEKMIGEALKNNKQLFTLKQLGFDHITVDEAHNFKNLFSKADTGANEEGKKGTKTNSYGGIEISGSDSQRAKRLFLLIQQILKDNDNRNVFMLTATPFSNNPLEVFNMLSYLSKDGLDKVGLYNAYQFMETYADVDADWAVDTNNNVKMKEIVKGFKNSGSLRSIIKNVILMGYADEVGIKRPEKHTITVKLEPNQTQLNLIRDAEEFLMENKTEPGAVFKALHKSKSATLSPEMAIATEMENPDEYISKIKPEEFIKHSPKLDYIMQAVASMKKKDPSTSQLIYMPMGIKYLPKIKQYLVDKGVFKQDEIAVITSDVKDDDIPDITDSFNDPNGKIKLIIGTEKIKEGMNLNKNSSVLYVPQLDWNPTDFTQIVGRIWRQGNKYKDIRVVVPLLKDSSDPFMFQKLSEKTGRLNDLMSDDSGEYIDSGELNTDEDKINMITLPDKKAKMYTIVESEKIDSEINEIKGKIDTVKRIQDELATAKSNLERFENNYRDAKERLSKVNKELDSYAYDLHSKNVKYYQKEVSKNKADIERLEKTIKNRELDINGVDSPEALQTKITELEEKQKNLAELTVSKQEEFAKEYAEQQKGAKTISEWIKDFEKETDTLYPTSKAKNGVNESKAFGVAPRKSYEKTAEAQYNVPVIKLSTQAETQRKSRKKAIMEKAKTVVDAKKYDKVLKRGVERWATEINLRRYDADRVLNGFIQGTKKIAKKLGVSDVNLREIMPFLRERTDFPSELAKVRPELKKVWDKVHQVGMADALTQVADMTSEKLERFWQEYKAVQGKIDGVENEDIENYIPHEWDLGDKRKEGLLNNFIMTKSKYAKQRTIESLYKGIQGIEMENGETLQLLPKELDYAKLLKMQTDSLIKATVDKTLADSVKSFKTDDGASLVLPASQAPSNWVTINNDALNKPVFAPVKTEYGEKVAPGLQNKLAEMGVAIGRRLSKYTPSGMPNALGKYVEKEPPEIRLQKWFSLKTLAHEVGHALDSKLNLTKDGFVNRHQDELLALNKERIEMAKQYGEKDYATSDNELIAELFGFLFNDFENASKIAPGAVAEVMDRMAKANLDSLLPSNFDWNSAKSIIEKNVVEFFKQPVKVHPDIASTLKTVFEEKTDYLDILGYTPGKTIDEANAVAKLFNFSLSLFHPYALSESLVGNVGAIKGLKEALNFKKIYDSVKTGNYGIYEKDNIARQAISDGLQIGATLDVQRGMVEGVLDKVGKVLEDKFPIIGKPFSLPVKGVSKVVEINNKALWDVIHNNYKLLTYETILNNEKNVTPEKRREVAQWVNDSFGGLVWEILGIGKKGKRTMSRLIMSPDWLLATTRQFMGMFSSETGHKALNSLASRNEFWSNVKKGMQFLGVNSMTDDIEASGMRGRIARGFWLRSFIISAIYMNVLNVLMRMWDKEKYPELYPKEMKPLDYTMFKNARGNKTTVFIGRNSDGTERYVRFGKQFREVPELLENPLKKLGGKGSPIMQFGSTAFTGRSLSGFEDRKYQKATGWGKVGLAGKELAEMYTPFSISSMINKKEDYTPFDLVATTGKGMTKYKATEEFKRIYNKNSNPKDLEDVRRSMRMSGYDKKTIQTVENRARGQAYSQYKKDYLEALESKNQQNVQKITNTMKRKNVAPMEQRKLYMRAFNEYLKNRGL